MPRIIENTSKPQFNSNKIETYCNKIIEELETTEKAKALFGKITKVVDNSGINIDDRDAFKLQSTNEAFLSSFKKH